MATDQAKQAVASAPTPTPANGTVPEHTYPPPPPPVLYSHLNGAPYPPGSYPGFYPYAPPEGANGETGASSPGYMMFTHPPPPGMMFTFPPGAQNSSYAPQSPATTTGSVPTPTSAPATAPTPAPASASASATAPSPAPASTPTPATTPAHAHAFAHTPASTRITTSATLVPMIPRPKRKQVKMACTNCAAACKRCDEHRPCERCQKYGLTETCIDGQRKERKKGVKRGPYKRKSKSGEEETAPDGEWSAGPGPPPPPQTPQTPVPLSPFPTAEGFYPIYYPPHGPGPFLALPPPPHVSHDGEGSPPHPMPISYYIHGAYPAPFYPPFLHAAALPPPLPQLQLVQQSASVVVGSAVPAGVDPAVTTSTDGKGNAAVAREKTNGKKRVREGKDGKTPGPEGQKAKKSKKGDKSPKEGTAPMPTPASVATVSVPATGVPAGGVMDAEGGGDAAEAIEVEAEVEVDAETSGSD